ncbi:TetR/AcrR family transcriptional regulator [Methylovirgula sp. 4M-Z18]|uniref:TetR/AcrR family transcriptional regulator n=1 Tax=Methylovirgula sp. 4M-Z18 TaxID=2293567 RepID=UPI000E2EC87E|nr:TetR/AcrR family transcriptional regulator [Methylovirgula sp. 4M-Z18]RFB78428.1 TetR/AcrR family transcriptional regulator [Methylovirgula sp. 4M-Z18]
MRPAAKRDGAQTRAKIEREALHLFATHGVKATSVRDIATAVGVSEPALYRHFDSKEHIAREIFEQHYLDLTQRVRAIAVAPEPFHGRIALLVKLFCDLFDNEPDVFTFILLNQHDHLQFIPDEEDYNLVIAIYQLFAEARDTGQIAILDTNLAVALALGAVVQTGVFMHYGRLGGRLQHYAPEITTSLLRLLGAKQPNRM